MSVIHLNETSLLIKGRFIRVGEIKDEYWLERASIEAPEETIKRLKNDRVSIDIFTFSQKLPQMEPKYQYYMEWDNVAALQIKTYEHWWNQQINSKTRNMVRKAEKKGVEVKIVKFDETLVKGIEEIYNETPVRQGRPFCHYGKDAVEITLDNATYLERSDFIGAFSNDKLIGFIKLVYSDQVAGMMQIISRIKERDKAPNNALIAKAVQICAEKQMSYLTYSKFTYGKKVMDPLSEFKHNNGFQKIDIPKYYIPLSMKGQICLKLGLHHELKQLLPETWLSYLRIYRAKWYKKK